MKGSDGAPSAADVRAALDTIGRYLESLTPEGPREAHVQALTLAEAAERLSVSLSGMRRLISAGRLRTIRVTPRRLCVRSDEVDSLLEEELL